MMKLVPSFKSPNTTRIKTSLSSTIFQNQEYFVFHFHPFSFMLFMEEIKSYKQIISFLNLYNIIIIFKWDLHAVMILK